MSTHALKNARYVLGILVSVYVPKNTNDAKEGADALAAIDAMLKPHALTETQRSDVKPSEPDETGVRGAPLGSEE